jgi:Asp-tRNA(Asn)/Glu-tRNA(Gln) amidotransferase C subunit
MKVATLATVQDFITSARRLLQDTVVPYRYADADMIEALNLAILEARRIRPDLFLANFDALPSYTAVGDTVDIEPMFRPAFVYSIVGRMELRDDEAASDTRAGQFLNKFIGQLLAAGA